MFRHNASHLGGQHDPEIAIVVPTHQGEHLETCVKSLLSQAYPNHHILIVDNASKQRNYENLFRGCQKLKIMRFRTNLGYAKANNVAASAVNAPYIAFLNDDVIVTKDWLTELVRVMDTNPKAGIVQPKLLKFDGKFLDSAGDYIDKFGFEMRRGGDWEEVDYGQYDEDVQIFSARGAAFLISKELFSRLGGFDENLSLTFTDIDLCWRARLEGYQIVYAPKSVVFHYGSASTPSSLRAYYSTRNRISILFKNYETCNALKFGFISIILNFVSVLGEIVISRNGKLAVARLRGIIAFLSDLKITLSKRREVQSSRKVSDTEIMQLMRGKPLLFTHWLRLYLLRKK